METAHTFLLLAGLLLLTVVVQPLAWNIFHPFTATLVIAGFLTSELYVTVSFDTGIQADLRSSKFVPDEFVLPVRE